MQAAYHQGVPIESAFAQPRDGTTKILPEWAIEPNKFKNIISSNMSSGLEA
jgi:hypothetical protein